MLGGPERRRRGRGALLADEGIRAELTVKLKRFLATLDLVLPRPEGLPFVRDTSVLSEIHTRARNRNRDGSPPLDKPVGRKVQALVFMCLNENEIVELDGADALADRLMELAKAKADRLTKR